MKASRLLLLAIALSPAMLLGQKKEELVSIQRDVADLSDQMKQLRKGLDDKVAALTALMQQSIEANAKTAAALAAMQTAIDTKMADQQSKMVAPLATLGTKLDETSGDVRSVQATVVEMRRKLNELDDKVSDISSTVRTMNANVPGPPPPATGTGVPQASTAAATPDTPPAGMSPELAYQAAYTDYMGKKDDLALQEFANYLKYYRQSSNAPNAQYFIGQIYYRAEDWESASKAFDAVVESYPKNPKTADAQYMKACALMNWKGHKNEAAAEFRNFLKNNPTGPHATEAHKHLREMGMDSSSTRRSSKDEQ